MADIVHEGLRFLVRLDSTRFRRRMAAMKRSRSEAREQALRATLRPVFARLVAVVPRDTNRLARGYAQGANEAGLGPIPVPPLRPSKYTELAERALARQEQRLEESLRAAEAAVNEARLGRLTKTGQRRAVSPLAIQRAEKRVLRVRTQLERARQETEKLGPYSIVVGLFGVGQKDRAVGTSVRDKVYGGTGSMKSTRDYTRVVVHNHEFHATFVERSKPQFRAILGLAGIGMKQQGRKAYKTRIDAGAMLGTSLK